MTVKSHLECLAGHFCCNRFGDLEFWRGMNRCRMDMPGTSDVATVYDSPQQEIDVCTANNCRRCGHLSVCASGGLRSQPPRKMAVTVDEEVLTPPTGLHITCHVSCPPAVHSQHTSAICIYRPPSVHSASGCNVPLWRAVSKFF